MAANDRQIAGDHYAKEGDFQHWDVVVKFKLDYFQGQITRYLFRWRDKGGVQDLKKAQHFLEKYIELAESASMSDPNSPVVQYIRQEAGSGQEISWQKVRVVRRKR